MRVFANAIPSASHLRDHGSNFFRWRRNFSFFYFVIDRVLLRTANVAFIALDWLINRPFRMETMRSARINFEVSWNYLSWQSWWISLSDLSRNILYKLCVRHRYLLSSSCSAISQEECAIGLGIKRKNREHKATLRATRWYRSIEMSYISA